MKLETKYPLTILARFPTPPGEEREWLTTLSGRNDPGYQE